MNVPELLPGSIQRQSDAPFCYAACFCEENVFLLCQRLQRRSTNTSALYVVFISNNQRQIPLWQQRAASAEDRPILWDYHVVLLEYTQQDRALIWDLDSCLELPCAFEKYVQHALMPQHTLPANLQRKYRVVSGQKFLANFASDRSHMMCADASWSSPPPPWPCIVSTEGATATLHQYLDMNSSFQMKDPQESTLGTFLSKADYGLVLSELDFIQLFTRPTSYHDRPK